jgi:hypothetical protein
MVKAYKDGYCVFTEGGKRISKQFDTLEEAEEWERKITKNRPLPEE